MDNLLPIDSLYFIYETSIGYFANRCSLIHSKINSPALKKHDKNDGFQVRPKLIDHMLDKGVSDVVYLQS
jgi:hypothetical protein